MGVDGCWVLAPFRTLPITQERDDYKSRLLKGILIWCQRLFYSDKKLRKKSFTLSKNSLKELRSGEKIVPFLSSRSITPFLSPRFYVPFLFVPSIRPVIVYASFLTILAIEPAIACWTQTNIASQCWSSSIHTQSILTCVASEKFSTITNGLTIGLCE